MRVKIMGSPLIFHTSLSPDLYTVNSQTRDSVFEFNFLVFREKLILRKGTLEFVCIRDSALHTS